METIKLNQDKNGNYVLNLTSLVYAIQYNLIATGTPIQMIESNGQISDFFLDEEEMEDGTMGKSVLLSEDDLTDPFYLAVDAYSLSAIYRIPNVYVKLEGWPTHSPKHFEPITYPEALEAIKKGRHVLYRDKPNGIYKTIGKGDSLTVSMLLEGSWFCLGERPEAPDFPKRDPHKKSLMELLDLDEEEYDSLKKEVEQADRKTSVHIKEYDLDETGLPLEANKIVESLTLTECRNIIYGMMNEGILLLEEALDGELGDNDLLFGVFEYEDEEWDEEE